MYGDQDRRTYRQDDLSDSGKGGDTEHHSQARSDILQRDAGPDEPQAVHRDRL